MTVYIIKENGYEDCESIIMGVYRYYDDAKNAIRQLRAEIDPIDEDWLYYSIEEAKVIGME